MPAADPTIGLLRRPSGAGLPPLPAEVSWWALIDDDAVTLPDDFTARVAAALRAHPADALISDFTVAGQVVRVGGWSVERARWQDYTGPVAVVAAGLLADLDPAIPPRVAALHRARSVAYLREPLYDAAGDRVTDLPQPVRAALLPADLPYRITGDAAAPGRRLPQPVSVTVVIPTRGGTGTVRGRPVRLIDHCLTALAPLLAADRGDAADPAADPAAPPAAPDVDVVLVVDDDTDLGYVTPWQARFGSRLTVVATPPPFNFARKINAGVAAARGAFVCLLNDDIEPVTASWLTELVALAAEPAVGAVGALLVYEDGTVQHAGHVMGGDGVHLVDNGRRPQAGPRRRNDCDRDVSGVSAACLVQRRAVWQELGGLDEAFPVSFNDVDYCERIRARGDRIVQCNAARLIHFESRTRAGGAEPWEVRLLRERHGAALLGPDPFTAWDPPAPPRFPVLRYRWSRVRSVYRQRGVAGVLTLIRASWRGSGQ